MHITYDRNGNAIMTDPDGETTPVIRGQGDSETHHAEPTAKKQVDGVADFVGAFVIVLIIALGLAIIAIIA